MKKRREEVTDYAIRERNGPGWWRGDRWTHAGDLAKRFGSKEEAREEAEEKCREKEWVVVKAKD